MEGRSADLLFTDEIRQPVEVSNLADVSIELCERNNLSGLYHWAGTEAMSRHEIGVRIARHFGLNTDALVRPISRAEVPSAAARPRTSAYACTLWPANCAPPPNPSRNNSRHCVSRAVVRNGTKETGRKVVRRLEKGVDF